MGDPCVLESLGKGGMGAPIDYDLCLPRRSSGVRHEDRTAQTIQEAAQVGVPLEEHRMVEGQAEVVESMEDHAVLVRILIVVDSRTYRIVLTYSNKKRRLPRVQGGCRLYRRD